MEARKLLLYLNHICKGNQKKIYGIIKNKTPIDLRKVENTIIENEEDYITILEKDYPEKYKVFPEPPIVVNRKELEKNEY